LHQNINSSKSYLLPSDFNSSLGVVGRTLSSSSLLASTTSSRRTSYIEGSDFSDSDSENEYERREAQRKRKINNFNESLRNIEKDNIRGMIEAIESTFKKLDQRTARMEDTVRNVNDKHSKVHVEINDNLSYISEMRARVKELIERQTRIARNYSNVEHFVESRSPVATHKEYTRMETPAFKPRRQHDNDNDSNSDVRELVMSDYKSNDVTESKEDYLENDKNNVVVERNDDDNVDESVNERLAQPDDDEYSDRKFDDEEAQIEEERLLKEEREEERKRDEEKQILEEEKRREEELIDDEQKREEEILEEKRLAERLRNELLEEDRLLREQEGKSEEEEEKEDQLARERAMEEIRKLQEEEA